MRNARNLSIAILLLLCLAAIFSSYYMITDPTGSSLGLPFYLLNGTVFSDYLAIGWTTLIIVGLFSIFVMIQINQKAKRYSFFIMLQGVLLVIFTIMQMVLFSETFLVQYVSLFLGVALIGLGAIQNQHKIAVETEKKPMPAPKSHHHKHRKHK